MRAHGNTPGPTQRPLLAGVVSGLAAFVPYEIVLNISGARDLIVDGFGIDPWLSLGIRVIEMILAGVIYAAIFKRAANDYHGGWLFGASFGFLIWMVAPISLWQLLTGRPIVVGRAAMGLFAANVLYGAALGLAFPWIHSLIQTRLDGAAKHRASRPNSSAANSDEEIKES